MVNAPRRLPALCLFMFTGTICICLLRIIFPELLSLCIPIGPSPPLLSHQIGQLDSSRQPNAIDTEQRSSPAVANDRSSREPPSTTVAAGMLYQPATPPILINRAYFQSIGGFAEEQDGRSRVLQPAVHEQLEMQPPSSRMVPANSTSEPQFLPDPLPATQQLATAPQQIPLSTPPVTQPSRAPHASCLGSFFRRRSRPSSNFPP